MGYKNSSPNPRPFQRLSTSGPGFLTIFVLIRSNLYHPWPINSYWRQINVLFLIWQSKPEKQTHSEQVKMAYIKSFGPYNHVPGACNKRQIFFVGLLLILFGFVLTLSRFLLTPGVVGETLFCLLQTPRAAGETLFCALLTPGAAGETLF